MKCLRITPHVRMTSFLIAFCLLISACSRTSPAPEGKESESVAKKEAPESAGEKEKKEGDKSDEKSALITMQAEAQKRAGVQTTPARVSSMPEYLDLTGTVQPIESRIAHVHALARGRLEQVLVKIGEHVTAGQPVAQFDNIEAGELSTQLSSAQSELARLKIQQAASARQSERNRRLVEIGAAAQKDLDASQAEQQAMAEAVRGQESTVAGLESRLKRFGVGDPASAQSSITVLRAPFAGVVLDIDSAPGAVIDSSNALLSVADLSSVYVEAQVYEKDMGRVRIGQAASSRTDSYPGTRFGGRVTSIGDRIDPQTRTTPVRCEVSNDGWRLKLDMFATVALPTSIRRNGLAVPADAVQNLEGKSVVFVRRSPTQFEIRTVNTGRTSEGTIEIASGLKEGEEVVTAGAFQVKSALLSKELGDKE